MIKPKPKSDKRLIDLINKRHFKNAEDLKTLEHTFENQLLCNYSELNSRIKFYRSNLSLEQKSEVVDAIVDTVVIPMLIVGVIVTCAIFISGLL